MSNLIERLRRFPIEVPGVFPLLSDAADEIERLTAERDEARIANANLAIQAVRDMEERDALRADAERYRFIRTNPQWIGWDSDFASEEVDREIDAARRT